MLCRFVVGLCLLSWVFSQDAFPGDVVYTVANASAPSSHPKIVTKPASGGPNAPETILFRADYWNSNPRFSWDKTRLVFASGMDYHPNSPPPLTLLYAISTSNSTPQRVTTLSSDQHNEFAADWSPDDSQFVIEYTWHSSLAGASESNTRLGTVLTNDDASFAPLMENLAESYNDYCARWNPKDGNYILFLSDRTEKTEIYLYDFRNQSASLLDLPPVQPATENCPFWDQSGQSFHYEVERKTFDQPPVMVVVNLENGPHFPKPEFRVKIVNSPSAFGIPEYLQCTSAPAPSTSFSCLGSGPSGDSIVIISETGELEQNVTTSDPSLFHSTPNWK